MRGLTERRWAGYWVMLSLLLLLGCSQVIDLDVEQSGGQIVIFGRITNGTQGNEVFVSRTGDIGQSSEAVSGAIVKVIDGDGLEETLTESQQELGKYLFSGNILEGRVGASYRLEADVAGNQYTTPLQTMQEVIGQDELEWEVLEEKDVSADGVEVSRFVVKVYGSTTFDELPEEFYVRWNIEESYTVFGLLLPIGRFPRYTPQQCYTINDLSQQESVLLDGTRIRTNQLGKQLFATRLVDRSFSVKHYFNLIHFATNREAHEYWSRINQVSARDGSIFDTPPAPVIGNIMSNDPDEEVLGFFEVAAVDTTRIFLTNNDIRVFFNDPCELRGEELIPVFRVPRECIQCLIDERIVEETCIFCNRLPNSTLTRPSYF